MVENNLTGIKVGKLTIIKVAGRDNGLLWLCKCDCGKDVVRKGSTLSTAIKKNTQSSCGCTMRKRVKHGLNGTRIYDLYLSMHQRCEDENLRYYKNYGGRGIRVCEDWSGENGALNFTNWAYANGYSDDLTLDRIDNNGNYEPGNCRWATYREQANNRRNSSKVIYNGKPIPLTEGAEIAGISRTAMRKRVKKGLSQDTGLFDPPTVKAR